MARFGVGFQASSASRPAGVVVALSLLVLLTAAVFRDVVRHDFVDFDDNAYITENQWVQSGLSPKGLAWAFTSTGQAAFFHPVTWISHMIDVELFGLDAGRHHLVSLAFHLANTALLWLVLARMTGAAWRSLAAAALFAVHPLHVESVAWAAERKDVLSMFFFLLALWGYRRYLERPGRGRYLAMGIWYLLGLMSKPMLVTFPLVLLILDYWPLGRMGRASPSADGRGPVPAGARLSLLVKEKLPLLALSAAFSLVIFLAQHRGGAVSTLGALSVGERLSNALVSLWRYLSQTAWPTGLAVYYPYPDAGHPWWLTGGAALVLILLTIAAAGLRNKHPYLLAGWLWYPITLLPVIGLVQVGTQSRADRFTYIPLTGIFIGCVWFMSSTRRLHRAVAAASTAVVLSLAAVSARQVSCWRDTTTLFEHAARVTEGNALANLKLGELYAQRGEADRSMASFKEALRVEDRDTPARYYRVGEILLAQGDRATARGFIQKAVELEPRDQMARFTLALLLFREGDLVGAIGHLETVVERQPEFPEARYQLGLALALEKRLEEAAVQLAAAVRIRPDFAEAQYNLGAVLEAMGYEEEAREHFERAAQLKPSLEAGAR